MQRLLVAAGSFVSAAFIAAALLISTGGSASAGPMMGSKTGDANMDGVTNSLDALRVMSYDAGLLPMPPYDGALHATSDVNCDKLLNAIDASLILQHTAGLINLRP
jgi:hypothetical protein